MDGNGQLSQRLGRAGGVGPVCRHRGAPVVDAVGGRWDAERTRHTPNLVVIEPLEQGRKVVSSGRHHG